MTDRPILFSVAMVQAIQQHRKTQTRRVLNPQPTADTIIMEDDGRWWVENEDADFHYPLELRYAPGDRLWVREAFTLTQHGMPVYRADARDQTRQRWASRQPGDPAREVRWKPSLHRPRSASRITLVVDDVRIQR